MKWIRRHTGRYDGSHPSGTAQVSEDSNGRWTAVMMVGRAISARTGFLDFAEAQAWAEQQVAKLLAGPGNDEAPA